VNVAGVEPRAEIAPPDLDALAAAVRALAAEQRAFAFVGGATQLGLGNAPRALDTVVRTTGLTRVVEYAPEDQTITVEAGMTFAALDAVLANEKQMLPLDVPDRARTTVGGAIAANAFGARRQRYGTVKDLIVGVGIVRPDGTRVRGGGKVVKNVAGFDLPKLMVGSLGTLGGIATATLRVYPLPEADGAVIFEGGDPFALVRALEADRLEPVAVVTFPRDARTLVTFEGVAAAVDAQCERAVALAAACGARASRASADERDALLARERRAANDGAWRLRFTTPRDALGVLDAKAANAWVSATDDVRYPSLGIARVYGYGDLDCDEIARRAATTGATCVVEAMPDAWRGRVDAWGPPPASFPVMRALKATFDPHGLCNPGRFVGGL
jgi:glycolate oxidase FAD binding subunit